ncbi:MAG TPA: hypothetical protein VH062_24170 [Polyangiaceae bacterium]|nr:hypothetical protein [Polyangiaceae bacterium]
MDAARPARKPGRGGVRHVLFGAAFLALLWLPLAKTALTGGEFEATMEKRFAAPVPAFSWSELGTLPARLEAAFDDRFAFRLALIRIANLVQVHLGVSPNPDVLIGRDGWLFYAGEKEIAEYRRLDPYDAPMLRAYTDVFEKRRAWLAYRGIRYLFFVAPNKDVVYPEHVPRALERQPGASRLDELLDSLEKRTGVDVVDLRPALATARRTDLVYDVTDTHWNGLGAFVAYEDVARKLATWFPAVVPLTRAELVVTRTTTRGGDLAGLLALAADLPETNHVKARPRAVRALEADPGMPASPDVAPAAQPVAREVHDAKLPRAVVLCDSFVERMIPFLSEHFSRVLYLRNHDFPVDVLERERPDVVIDEIVERGLMRGAPVNPRGFEHDLGDALVSSPPGMDGPHASGFVLPSSDAAESNDVRALPGGKLEATGNDPYVVVRTLPFDVTAASVAWIRLSAAATRDDVAPHDVSAQLFWAAPDENFVESASVRFPIVVDGALHEYRVVPGLSRRFTGQVERFRLDFADERPGFTYELRGIELY